MPRDSRGPEAAFYCVSSAEYFLGAAAMINSLRLVGHREPIFVMDCGMTLAQRQSIAPEATIVSAPRGREPYSLKAVLPLAHPAEVMVHIDTDMIVSRSLAPLLARASEGRVVAFENNSDRFVAQWGPLLDLGPLEHRPYLCSGLIALGRTPGDRVLALLEERQQRVDLARTYFGAHDPSYPLLYADQDVLNAILCSAEVRADQAVALEYRLAPMVPFAGLEVVDARSLRCAYADGTEPFLVHHSLSPKPWQRAAGDGVYSSLLRRLLDAPDLAVQVPRGEIPLRLRDGRLAAAARRRTWLQQRISWGADGLLGRLGRRRSQGA